LTLTNSNAAQDARAIYLNLTGSPVGAAVLEVPAIEKPYIVKNGADEQVTIKVSGQTGVPIPTGKTALVYNNGIDVVTSLDYIPSLTLGAALPVASGGTGATTSTGSGAVVLATNPTLVGATLGGNMDAADYLITKPTLKDYAVEGSAIGNTGATRTFDLTTANFFSATLDEASTFTFSNPPASGDFGTFVMELTNGGAFVITWPASVDWVGGTPPTLTAAGVDQLVFTTRDGGTTYFGFVAGLDIKSPA